MHTKSFARGLLVLGFAVGGATAAACYVGPLENESDPTSEKDPTEDPDDHDDSRSSASSTDPATGGAPGLPCDVDAVLKAKCRTCHGAKPSSPMSLVTFEDLTAPSKSDPKKNVAALSLERMKSEGRPMPPNPSQVATPKELAAFEKWLKAGLPATKCEKPGTPAKPDAGAAADASRPETGAGGGDTTCTSGLTWDSSERVNRMNPGKACIGCHEGAAGRPILQIAGTVYNTLHEVDKCYGTQVPGYVVVKDATGRSVTLGTGLTGNFTLSTEVAPLVYPISVKVVRNGKENVMHGSPPHGDCNACHTQAGKNGAPGRILLP